MFYTSFGSLAAPTRDYVSRLRSPRWVPFVFLHETHYDDLHNMRAPFFIALIISMIAGSVYWYQSTAAICPVPLFYRIGEIDTSFELTREEAKSHVLTAETLWEETVGRELFVYDEAAAFTIDFIFDERQAIADSEESTRLTLDEQRAENERVQNTISTLQAEYESLQASYRQRLAAYEESLQAYNDEVTTYNDRGGAPADIFSQLESKRTALDAELETLSSISAQLNELANEINRLADRGNQLIEQYNKSVDQYNTQFGYAREFTQGDYQGDKIHIYKFSNETELITVLAHEFGHALGIDHVEGSSSLMYYLLGDTSQMSDLSEEDVQAFVAVCGLTETIEQKIRQAVREFLTK